MLRKFIAIFMILVMSFTLYSCSGKNKDVYTDENGNQYIVVRNGDGDIVVNDSGKLQVYTLNENGKKQKKDNGEYITEYIDFNGQVVFSKTVETVELKFEIPSKFTDDINNPGYFYYEPYDGEIFFNYYNEDVDKQIEAAKYNCESLLESFGSESFSYEIYSVTVDGIECTAIKQASTSSEHYRNSYLYFIPFDSGYYSVNCMINTDDAKKVDFLKNNA